MRKDIIRNADGRSQNAEVKMQKSKLITILDAA
jgi:hypothetical protein